MEDIWRRVVIQSIYIPIRTVYVYALTSELVKAVGVSRILFNVETTPCTFGFYRLIGLEG